MNKELIKKYKTEFDHWLNGGKILYASYDLDEKKYSAWYELHHDCKWDHNNVYRFKFIINDEYVEFRKALAEGKIIEYLNYKEEWENLTENCRRLEGVPLKELRIKPEESKFKVGDWVVNKTSKQRIIKKVTSVYSDTATVGDSTSGINVMLIKDLELWQPKPGEWCWFYQNKREIPTLGNLKYFSDKDSFCAYSTPKASMSVKYFKHCEPFLGQLPTNLKEPL